jgi:capsular polysaccharide biosynthesis protein
MEIRDYLRAIRRVLWLVIAVPIVAGLLTGGFMELQPSVYEADATVVVPAISAVGSSASAATQYVAGFKDVLVSQPVLADVSQKYRIPVGDLAAGLSASTTTASSNIIHVVLQMKRNGNENLVGAVHEATVDSLNAIALPRSAQALSAQTNAQTLLTNADNNITNFDGQYGTVAPLQLYVTAQQVLTTEIANLARVQSTTGNAKEEAGINILITQYTKNLAQYGLEVEKYQQFANAKAAAVSAYDHATQQVVDAQALIAADANPSAVTTSGVVRLSKLSNTIKFAGIAFALGLLMMLGLILVLELMRSGKTSPAVKADPSQGAFAWDREPAPLSGVVPTPVTTAPVTTAPVSAPAEPAVARSESASRDPWHASSAATATAPSAAAVVPATTSYGNGNVNGNGHANGNGNGNGHANGNVHAEVGAVADRDADPQQAVRRR